MASLRMVRKCKVSPVSTAISTSIKRFKSDLPPLNEALEVEEKILSSSPRINKRENNQNEIQITILDNGMKVASENSFGQFSTIGALINGGSRYEIDYPSGVTHLLEKIAFQSTENFKDNDAIIQKMENLGGHVDCQAFRDCFVYAASALKHNVEGVIEVLSDSMWRAKLTDREVEEQKETIMFELENLDFQPDVEPQLTDLIHAAAFNGNTLGLPKLCPQDSLPMLSSTILRNYIQRYYRPERITIAGVNVDHDELVKCCEKYFVADQPSWLAEEILPPDQSIAQYIGGLLKDHRPEPRLQPGITQLPELLHVAIGFESANYKDKDMFPFAVLNMLMGGGGSFSAGGPGKGMYSRLYTNVLNRNYWMFSSTAFNHSYEDSGLFCIHSSAHPSDAKEIVSVITREYDKMVSEKFNEVEVARAKKQAQSMLMMNLESRIVRFEDIGRQVLGLGHRIPPNELYERIEAVSENDLHRISEKMMSGKMSVAAIGNCTELPDFSDIQNSLRGKSSATSSVKRFIFNR